MMEPVALALLIGIVAAVYASVGLAGATGYLALLALFGVEPMAMKASSLLLNSVVALIGTIVFSKNADGRRVAFAAMALPAVPMAFVGGMIQLPAEIYLPVVGILLLGSAVRLLRHAREDGEADSERRVPIGAGIALGAGVGFASGLTGTGGGIFLLPALQLLGWASPATASQVVAPFVLVTSVAALSGYLWQTPELPIALVFWVPAAMIGGLIGARAGRDRLNPATLRTVLAALLIIAGLKLLVS